MLTIKGTNLIPQFKVSKGKPLKTFNDYKTLDTVSFKGNSELKDTFSTKKNAGSVNIPHYLLSQALLPPLSINQENNDAKSSKWNLDSPVNIGKNITLSEEEYKKELSKYQKKLEKLQDIVKKQNREVIIVFEGWDAAGKGGAIERLVKPLNKTNYKITPICAPTKRELQENYQGRFWNALEESKGKFNIFDRSWYGRVLVERVEGFAKEKEWKNAYEEINNFEKTLSENGAIIIKFFINIDKDEQLARFKAREENPEKSWKLTEEDWRNREKWDEYKVAIQEMFEKTSTKENPWHLIPGNCKKNARIEVLKTITDTIGKACNEY